MVPLQLLIGILLIALSSVIESTLYSESPNVLFLTVVFFTFYLLAATQDIAVDGWALTMLSKKNSGWQSTCNTVGQTLGIHLASRFFPCFPVATPSSRRCTSRHFWRRTGGRRVRC